MLPKDFYAQENFDIRCEWGREGVERLSPICSVLIIVDVLSFTTSVDLATSQGAEVYPYDWNRLKIEEFARLHQIEIADDDNLHRRSLKPSSLTELPPGLRLVMPSPNGSTLSTLSRCPLTLAGSLRNAWAVANYANGIEGAVGVVPSGERWENDSLRPAYEDLLGAGAIIAGLRGRKSPEAEVAALLFKHCSKDCFSFLSECVSGQEKAQRKLVKDIALAADLNCSHTVPQLQEGRYVAVS